MSVAGYDVVDSSVWSSGYGLHDLTRCQIIWIQYAALVDDTYIVLVVTVNRRLGGFAEGQFGAHKYSDYIKAVIFSFIHPDLESFSLRILRAGALPN